MTFIVPAVLGGVALSVMALVSVAASRRRRAQPAQARVDLPTILVHDINEDRCTGCDACVAVCPTNVLDLVDNKSRVLNFADCIQCEACMWACPTEALVMHAEGTEPPSIKMPELDDVYQTAVPGQYLIGEVAGKPLVKNAANLGRGVIEHMLSTGLRPNALARSGSFAEGSDATDVTCVDVTIVGSGPGGLSAALTCIQRGLSYVVLEKDNVIASTIAHYPKGKLVMAEPYKVANLSLLPVFDSSKEQLIQLWQDLCKHVDMKLKLGEAVETVDRRVDGSFDVRTNVASYRSQKVVLATGTRGKPRTLSVPGENLAKVQSLLDDPEIFSGKPVAVIGGGDSACEAALALADAGAKVIMSYRGRSFSRAQPKNKSAIESYVAQRRIKVKYQSVVERFDDQTLTLVMSDGTRKKYPNLAAFVLIGSDAPVRWLSKLGIDFVERPHQYQLSGSADLIRRFLPDAAQCPGNAEQAAALVRGQDMPAFLAQSQSELDVETNVARLGSVGEVTNARDVSGPRKWIRSATGLFSKNAAKNVAKDQQELQQPMPLAEFAKRGRRHHTGHGRRDELDPRERTRVLRMLRDEGGRLADEDSRVYVIESKSELVFDSPPPGFMVERTANASEATPAPAQISHRNSVDGTPKQAVIVGLARAMAEGPTVSATGRRRRKSTGVVETAAAEPRRKRRSSAPPQFFDEQTRQVDPRTGLAPGMNDFSGVSVASFSESDKSDDSDNCDDFGDFGGGEATRAVDLDAEQLMKQADDFESAEFLRPSDVIVSEDATGAIHIDTGAYPTLEPSELFDILEDNREEATFAMEVNNLAQLERLHAKRRRPPVPSRASSLSDVEWDLD